MKTPSFRRLGLLLGIGLAFAIAVTSAFALQPGTSGTEKRWQQSGLRIGVPVMVNNTATAVVANAGVTSTATLNNAGAGVITTDSLTTAASTEWALTLTNNMIAAADIVLVTVGNGTNTTRGATVTTVTPAAGSVVINVRNGNGTNVAFNGTLKIGFLVIKQSALNAD